MSDMHRYRPRRRYSRSRFDVARSAVRASRRRAPVTPRVSLAARIRIAVLVVLVLAAVLGVRWFTGDAFMIADAAIRVDNNQGVPPAQIIGASGLAGEHFAFADLEAAAKRVDELPGVDAAEVSCTWEWQVGCSILVQVSQALAVWEAPQGLVWVDRSGKVQQALGDLPASLRLRSEAQDGNGPNIGETIPPDLLRTLNELADLAPDARVYVYSSRYGVTYSDAGGWRVRLGLAERDGEMSEKLALAQKLRAQLATDNIGPGVIDVRFVEAPYYASGQ